MQYFSLFDLKKVHKQTPIAIFYILKCQELTLSWRRPLSYRNQSMDLLRKLMDWFLYDNGLHHEGLSYIKNLPKLVFFYLVNQGTHISQNCLDPAIMSNRMRTPNKKKIEQFRWLKRFIYYQNKLQFPISIFKSLQKVASACIFFKPRWEMHHLNICVVNRGSYITSFV